MTTERLAHEPLASLARRACVFTVSLLCFLGCGGAPARAMPSMPAPVAAGAPEAPAMASSQGAPNGFSDVNTDRTLNTSSHVRAWTDDLLATASRFRKQVYKLDGYVNNERIDYEDTLRAPVPKLPSRAPQGERGKAIFSVALPIEKLPELLDWVRIHAIVVEEYVVAVRDSSIPAPAALVASERQRQLLEQRLAAVEAYLAQASDSERPAVEAEIQSLRNQIAAYAQQSAAAGLPLVKYATLDVYIEAGQRHVRFSAAWVAPAVRASLLVTDLLSSGDTRDVRLGAAVSLAVPSSDPGGLFPAPLLELAGYPATADHEAGLLITLGGGRYARSLGDGQNTWLNPFAGFRLGYAYFGQHSFVAAGELGVELFKSSGVALSASIRPMGLIGSDSQAALEAGSSLTFAF